MQYSWVFVYFVDVKKKLELTSLANRLTSYFSPSLALVVGDNLFCCAVGLCEAD